MMNKPVDSQDDQDDEEESPQGFTPPQMLPVNPIAGAPAMTAPVQGPASPGGFTPVVKVNQVSPVKSPAARAPSAAEEDDDDDQTDSVSTRASAPDPQGSDQFDLKRFLLQPEDLQAAREKESNLAMMGGVGQLLANRQSFGNFFLGRMQPQQDVMSGAKAQMGIVDQGVADKQSLLKQAMQRPEIEFVQKSMDPNSEMSKTAVSGYQTVLQTLQSGLGKTSPELAAQIQSLTQSLPGKSYAEVERTIAPIAKLLNPLDIANIKNEAFMKGLQYRQFNADRNFDMKQDAQAAGAAGALDKDQILQATQRQLNQLAVDRHTLTTAKIITPQMVHEISGGIAGALNQGKAVGLGQAERQDLSTLQTKIAALEQMLTNSPQNGASPEIKAQIVDTLDRLSDSYSKIQAARAKQVSIGKQYQHNPAAQQALEDKVQSYQAPAAAPSGGLPGGVTQDDIQAEIARRKKAKGGS